MDVRGKMHRRRNRRSWAKEIEQSNTSKWAAMPQNSYLSSCEIGIRFKVLSQPRSVLPPPNKQALFHHHKINKQTLSFHHQLCIMLAEKCTEDMIGDDRQRKSNSQTCRSGWPYHKTMPRVLARQRSESVFSPSQDPKTYSRLDLARKHLFSVVQEQSSFCSRNLGVGRDPSHYPPLQ